MTTIRHRSQMRLIGYAWLKSKRSSKPNLAQQVALSLARVAPEFRISVMPIPEIIDEIDAYLSRLRQARELLLVRSTEAPQKSAPRPKRKANLRPADPASSPRRQTAKNKPRSDHPVGHQNIWVGRVDVGVPVPSSVTHDASHSEPPASTQPESTISTNVVIKRLPSKGPRTSIRSMRHRTPKSNAGTKPDAAKPAIALAGPAGAKIVVVPAEQVRRERERAAQPEVRRPRVPASGLTGRLAFEALFK